MKIIAMIPARMGSKRIPHKNIRFLADKPLIYYPIDLALKSNCFESIWINTESEQLGNIAVERGIQFHKRPVELASDTATNRDFMYEFLKKHECDYVIMINPTSPLLSLDTLLRFVDFVKSTDYDTYISVVSYKSETFYESNPVNFSLSEKINSQFLTPVDVIAWALTAWKKELFITNQDNGINPVFGGKVGLFSIPKDECCDLDTPEDWNIAEGLIMSKYPELKFKEKYMSLEV